MLHRVLFMLLLVWCSSVSASPPLTLTDQQTNIDLAPYLELLEDPSGTLSIDQITTTHTKQFQANTAAVPDFGRTRSTWWARFQLRSTTDQQDWYLLLNRPIGGVVEVFVEPRNAHTTLRRLSDYSLPIFHLHTKPDETITIYLRGNNGNALFSLPLQWLNGEQLLKTTHQRTLAFTALFASMVILAIYNVLLFFSLREPPYLSLTLFIGAADLLFLRDSGLFTGIGWLQDSTHYFYNLSLLLVFASAFHYWKYINQGVSPTMEYLCNWIPRLALLAIPFSGLLHTAEALLFGMALVLVPIIIVSSTLAAWRGHEPTRHFYWVMLVLVLGMTPYALMQVEYFTYDVKLVYLAQSSMLLALLMLSFKQGQQTRRVREAKERMEAISKTKDEFLTTMSHELRTPMNAVVGINTLLNMTPLNAEQQDCVHKLEISSSHLLRLIDEVLDLSRMQQVGITLNHTPFPLNSLLDELRHMFSVLAENKGLRLHIPSAAYQDSLLLGDSVRLSQILTNLLGNAIKCTAQGEVRLNTRLEQQDDSGVTLHFSVTDTGCGIAPEHLPRLFEAFYQTSPQHQSGSGLGLAISHKLVTRMGGTLTVESTVGQGSHFHFSLRFPTQTAAYEQNDPPLRIIAYPANHLSGAHILLVDDDEINLFVSKKLLMAYGAILTTAANGAIALQHIRQQQFDLVFMDVSLPDQNGYEVTKIIRADARFPQLPIIALTAHTTPGIRERCLAAGMNDFLGKPFKLEELLTVAAHWIPSKAFNKT